MKKTFRNRGAIEVDLKEKTEQMRALTISDDHAKPTMTTALGHRRKKMER
jgi:lambda repressor-like predicted transcriptional regulator